MYDPQESIVTTGDVQSKQGLDVGYNCIYRSDGQRPHGNPYPHDLWGVNPRFVNAAVGDFHFLPDSPLIDRGIILDSVVDDFDGFPRPLGSGYDIGAYEYSHRINTNPPIVHKNDTLNITISFATIGKSITITIILPVQLDYLSSSSTCPASVTYSDASRTVTLSGDPPPVSDCKLQIYTIVNTDQKVSVTLSGTIDYGLSIPQNISRTIILNGLPHYLPLIRNTP